MVEDLGSRLVAAGLVTREQLAEGLSRLDAPLVMSLVEAGLDESSLADFLERIGLGRTLERAELGRPDPRALELIPSEMVVAFIALPLRLEREGLLVAMANPLDIGARAEISRRAGRALFVLPARLTDIVNAIVLSYPGADFRARAEHRPTAAESLSHESIAAAVSFMVEETGALPLVRTKAPSMRARATPDPVTSHEPADDDSTAHEPTAHESAPNKENAMAAPPPGQAFIVRGEVPVADRWDALLEQPLLQVPAHHARDVTSATAPPTDRSKLPDTGSMLAHMRLSTSRDEIIRLACQAGAAYARAAVFLSVQRNVARGRDGSGPGISATALHYLVIPLDAPSILSDAIRRAESYLGPFGLEDADEVFRAAIGSRGGELYLVPVLVRGRVVGVLCADGPRYGERGIERIAAAAGATADAFERLIQERKRR